MFKKSETVKEDIFNQQEYLLDLEIKREKLIFQNKKGAGIALFFYDLFFLHDSHDFGQTFLVFFSKSKVLISILVGEALQISSIVNNKSPLIP